MNLFTLFIIIGLCINKALCKKLNVGIIGGGIGGTSTAYFLQQLLKDDVDITLFEGNKIGGRLHTRTIDNKRYEVGGSVLIERNKHMVKLAEELGLKRRKSERNGYSSLYDGTKAVFVENEWRIATIVQLAWRYGFGIYRLNSHIREMLDTFDRIYDLQNNLQGFENVTSLLFAMNPNFAKDLSVTTEDGFAKEGFSKELIQELVAATLKTNYGQHLKVHKFVGSVSVAGAGGGLWAVEGGNERVPEKLLESSKAKVVMRTVSTIIQDSSGKFKVVPKSRSDIPPDDDEFEFDVVVLATPQTTDQANRITFKGFSDENPVFNGVYHRTVTTVLRGNLRYHQFPGIYPYTDEILTTKPGIVFNSISRIYPVDSEPPVAKSDVWKIFSQKPLSTAQIEKFFENPTDVTVVDWLAYPEYSTDQRTDNFLLAPGLYHINGIEWAASAMEMSLIGAKNVAILVRNKWCEGRSCPSAIKKEKHTEL